MASTIVPLNSAQHGHLKVKAAESFSQIANEQLVPVVVHDYLHVGSDFPIVYAKDSNTGKFVSVALMGLKPGENLFFGQGRDESQFVKPAVFHNYPFSLALEKEGSDNTMVCIDEDSDLVGAIEGEALFTEGGEQTDFLKQRTEGVVSFIEKTNVTKHFVDFLVENDLLVSQDLTVNVNGQRHAINGVYIVNEKSLNALPSEKFEVLRTRGFLPAIYAQMFSLQQIKRLVQLKQQDSE